MMFNTIFTKNNKITVQNVGELVQSGQSVAMVLPLSIGTTENDLWLFPIEPLISISGKNIFVKRNVAKSNFRGTIKERWTEDDFQISIQGAFIHDDLLTYPSSDLQKLMYYIRQKRELTVKNELLAILDINHIVIESYDFPFSKGENVQNFSINALSDHDYTLFIDKYNV